VSPKEAIAFVQLHGVVLQAARGQVPCLTEAIARGPIRGSWWGHAKGRAIFRAARAVCESPDVLVCKLIDGKVTYIHRRLWPALVKLSRHFAKERLAKIWDEHTATGAHASRQVPFPDWVPRDVMEEAERLPTFEAERVLSKLLAWKPAKRGKLRPGKTADSSDAAERRSH
jgi:hypothetical protein